MVIQKRTSIFTKSDVAAWRKEIYALLMQMSSSVTLLDVVGPSRYVPSQVYVHLKDSPEPLFGGHPEFCSPAITSALFFWLKQPVFSVLCLYGPGTFFSYGHLFRFFLFGSGVLSSVICSRW